MALGGQSLLKANAKCQAASMQQRLCRWGCWREGRWWVTRRRLVGSGGSSVPAEITPCGWN